MLQSSAKIRQPSWFNRTINYKRASEDALRAKQDLTLTRTRARTRARAHEAEPEPEPEHEAEAEP